MPVSGWYRPDYASENTIRRHLCRLLPLGSSEASNSKLSREEELEIEEHLKLLNKPSIKTYKTKEGDIIDCVDINKQPALDHPLLKNHKVQVVSHSLEKGTEKYYGTKSYMSVYNVSLSFDQSSSTNIWIVGGPVDSLGVLMTGWLVNPEVNGDFVTRSFVYWTADGGTTTGCYNMYCQGFVQVNPSHHVGAPLLPTSTYEGQQYDYQFTIIQIEGNWWVLVGENLGLGYWPKELIQNLVDGADQIAWGGIAQPSIDGVSPMLGSGHKPNENGDYNEGCYIRNIQIISGAATNTYVLPTWDNTLSYSSNTSCYDLNPNVNCGYDMMEYCFTFGGPGGPNCEATIF
ncbi:uncharacterized protein LOC105435061 [Cucumis sativus]|nr:uncharacterized protein LOC105435061 [Cucumis sativus]